MQLFKSGHFRHRSKGVLRRYVAVQVRVGRSYGRVCRQRLRERLLSKCVSGGVQFLAAEVADVQAEESASSATLVCEDGVIIRSRCGSDFYMRVSRMHAMSISMSMSLTDCQQ